MNPEPSVPGRSVDSPASAATGTGGSGVGGVGPGSPGSKGASRSRPASIGGTHSGRRLAAVVFTDVVGYSARMQRDETGTMALVAADFTLMREQCEQHGGEVLNSMGDGLLLCFASAVQAVAWALRIQSEFGRRRASVAPGQSLEHRMGIHIGDVFRQEAGGLAGDGVNIAARLEGKAPAGGVCVSQMVYDTVKGKVPMQAVFIGPESFKNIAEPIPIWHITSEGGLAPRAACQRRLVPTFGGLAAAAVLVLGGLVAYHSRVKSVAESRGEGAPVPAAGTTAALAPIPAQSIAVMPFENFSDDKANGYLADGLQEDMLTNLAGIRGLKVAPRASAVRYRGTTKSVKDVGLELGVAYLLNGSVRREGNKIRVSAELVDARSEQQVWARKYDREVNDLLSIQSALADEIVPALQVVLSPEEKAALGQGPTKNESAYALFLQAKSARLNGDLGDGSALKRAEALLRQAVATDPGFVRAWVELSVLYTDRYREPEDHTPARIAQAQEAIEAARRLSPDAPEVLLGLARIRYYCYRDFAGAMLYTRQVLTKYPNYPDAHLRLGLVQRRLGRWPEALEELREAWRQEPGNLLTGRALADTLAFLHRYEEAYAIKLRLLALAPNDIDLGYDAAFWEFIRTGTREAYDRWLARIPPQQANTPRIVELRFSWAMDTGDAAMVRDLIKQHGVTIDHMDAVVALLRANRREEALRLLDGIKPELERRRTENPVQFYNWIELAKYHALRGDRAEAFEAMNQARQLLPETSDAINGAGLADANADMLVWLGDTEAALGEIERLLKEPGDMHVWYLRSALTWQVLHGNPRFEAILADPRNSAPL